MSKPKTCTICWRVIPSGALHRTLPDRHLGCAEPAKLAEAKHRYANASTPVETRSPGRAYTETPRRATLNQAMKIPNDIKQKVISALADTSGEKEGLLCDEHSITIEDIEEIMVDAGYERCKECEWWCECGELVDEAGDLQACDSCRGH